MTRPSLISGWALRRQVLSFFLASIAVSTRLLSLGLGLLLAGPLCLCPQPLVGQSAAGGTLPAAPPQAGEAPVGRLILALLDKGAVGNAGADARLALQAGASVRAFYGPAPGPAWTVAADSITPAAAAALGLLAAAPTFGLRADDYGWVRLMALRDSLAHPTTAAADNLAARQARFEVYLSDAVLRLMLDLYRGRLRPTTLSPREVQTKQIFQPAETLRAGLAANRVGAAVRACQPTNREYRLLQAALVRWLRAPVAPDSAALRQARYEQIALNLERWRWEAITEPEYILINLPAFVLQVVRGDTVQQQHRVIVGQSQTPTPTLSSAITYFTTAPDWHVPRSIAIREMLPRLQKDPGYLGRNNLTLYDQQNQRRNPYHIDWKRVTPENFPYTMRQSSGCDNALGNIVFRFNNPYSVYLHDTPVRELFDRPQRALSHGCVRVSGPMRLAAYLLRRDGRTVRLPSEVECANQPEPRHFLLRRPMPFYVRYLTCAADGGGQVRFLPDVYHHDDDLRRALFPPVPKPAVAEN